MIRDVFERLDYKALGKIYCDEGGDVFWNDRKGPCQKLGIKIASHLRENLPRKGRSLYIGVGVAELPMLITENTELDRSVKAYNLRKEEVGILSQACSNLSIEFKAINAQRARGSFDHIWIVSVLNDPECYPETSALSYGRAIPLNFDPDAFKKERRILTKLLDSCLSKLSCPSLVTTSIEELPWITKWCLERKIPFRMENKTLPTAIVGDPLCFLHIGGN